MKYYISVTQKIIIFSGQSPPGHKRGHSFNQRAQENEEQEEEEKTLHFEWWSCCLMQVCLISLCCPETSTSNFCLSEVSFASFWGLLKTKVLFWMRRFSCQVFSCQYSNTVHFLPSEVVFCGCAWLGFEKQPSPNPLRAKLLRGTTFRNQKKRAGPPCLLHSSLPGGSFSGNSPAAPLPGLFISSHLILTPQLPLVFQHWWPSNKMGQLCA